MSKKNRVRTSNITAAVWLIGLGILWLTNLWWPGILILIGVSLLVQTMVPGSEPEKIITPKPEPVVAKEPEAPVEPEKAEDVWEEDESETPAFIQPQESKKFDAALLPQNCPACGGPVFENAHKVEWLDEKTAKCPFCNYELHL